MSERPKLARRAVLAGAVLAVPALAYAGMVAKGVAAPCDDSQAVARLESLRRIGRSYLRGAAPAEVRRAMLDELRRDPRAFRAAAAGMAESLAQKARRDFETGTVVSCEGWVLSESEAQYCARIALLGPSAHALVASG